MMTWNNLTHLRGTNSSSSSVCCKRWSLAIFNQHTRKISCSSIFKSVPWLVSSLKQGEQSVFYKLRSAPSWEPGCVPHRMSHDHVGWPDTRGHTGGLPQMTSACTGIMVVVGEGGGGGGGRAIKCGSFDYTHVLQWSTCCKLHCWQLNISLECSCYLHTWQLATSGPILGLRRAKSSVAFKICSDQKTTECSLSHCNQFWLRKPTACEMSTPWSSFPVSLSLCFDWKARRLQCTWDYQL